MRSASEFGRRTEADREADWGEINGEKGGIAERRARISSSGRNGASLRPSIVNHGNASKFITSLRTNTPHSISLLLLIVPTIHPARWQHVRADVQLVYCSEKYTLACLTVVTYRIRGCNLNGASLMSCHLARVGGISDKATSLQTPPSIYVSIRVNEQWLSFEPESRAVIRLSSNTPTSSNDAKNTPGYACARAV